MFDKLIKPVILILALTFVSGSLFNLLSENSLPFIYKAVDLEPGMDLGSEQAYRVLREGRALFIDARYEREYRAGHIPGAVSVPSNLPRDELTARLKPVARNAVIVVYCSSVACLSARRLAGFMTYLGFRHVAVYLAGFDEWQQLNYPVEKE